MTGFIPTNQNTLYLLCLFYSDNEIITVHGRPAICTIIGWIETSRLFLSYNRVSWVLCKWIKFKKSFFHLCSGIFRFRWVISLNTTIEVQWNNEFYINLCFSTSSQVNWKFFTLLSWKWQSYIYWNWNLT